MSECIYSLVAYCIYLVSMYGVTSITSKVDVLFVVSLRVRLFESSSCVLDN